MKHRWPRSIHCQIEAVYHSIRAIRQRKDINPEGVRSFGTWKTYKYESHRFADFLIQNGIHSLLDTEIMRDAMEKFLKEKLDYCVRKRQSRQTFETILSALGKLQYAVNTYIAKQFIEASPLDTESLRMGFYTRSKILLKRFSRKYDSRAYPDPVLLINTISNGTYQLQAALQFEGGLRAEGVGAPRDQHLKNPLTARALRGIGPDPVSGLPVGHISSKEKGGKETVHYISVETYQLLENYIQKYGKLESDYFGYINALNQAARETDQYVAGRGSHGLKHNFGEERYQECVAHGMSHEEAMQQTSIEMAHFRLNETLTYTRGSKK